MPNIANVTIPYSGTLPAEYEKVIQGVALHFGLTARQVRESPPGIDIQLTDEDFTLTRNASFKECVKMVCDEVPKSLARKRPMPTPSSPSSDPKRMAALIRNQIADVERIKLLDFEHLDVFKWESDTIAVLRPLGKDGAFLSRAPSDSPSLRIDSTLLDSDRRASTGR